MNTSPAFIEALRDASTFAPELPQSDAFDTLARVESYERALIVGSGTELISVTNYAGGTARYADEVVVFGVDSERVLISADHATDPFKKSTGQYRGADHGTAGLAVLLSKQGAQAIVPLGRQTGNVAVSPDTHPIKQRIGELLPGKAGFISLHGMASGKLTTLHDPTEIHAVVGLGVNPNEQSCRVAEKILAEAANLGLRAVIGNRTKHLKYDAITGGFELDEEGVALTGELKAPLSNMTTNYAYRVMETTGQQIPSVQLEMARLLRLIPRDYYDGWHKDRKARAMGVHLGYLLSKAAVDAAQIAEPGETRSVE